MTSSPPPPSDRRREPRHLACFPAFVEVSGEASTALIRDLSVTGALLLTRGELPVGEPVKLTMYVSDAAEPDNPVAVSARVVRCARRDIEQMDVWSHTAAVSFDEPLSGREADIRALEERLRDRGFLGSG